jgi:hypothetical protein
MPFITCRKFTRGRPPCGDLGYLGNSGWMCRQKASDINQLQPRNSFFT